jgi:hypothetical protein
MMPLHQKKLRTMKVIIYINSFKLIIIIIINYNKDTSEDPDSLDLIDFDPKGSIKSQSLFTKVFNDIYDQVLATTEHSNNETNNNSEKNNFFNPSFIKFLIDKFLPYIFLWGSYSLQDMSISRITNGTQEKNWGTRKAYIPHPVDPATYLVKATDLLMGQKGIFFDLK